MNNFFKKTITYTLIGLTALFAPAVSAQAVKQIDLYVTPYYESSPNRGRPTVNVSRVHNEQLASQRAEDIKAVAEDIKKSPDRITPMTLAVLAVRHYDVGLRDDAVFWFYVARARTMQAALVLDFDNPRLSEVKHAMNAFFTLAGPAINGYAFCDIPKQHKARQAATQWVIANPYAAIFVETLPGATDRKKGLQQANEQLLESVKKEQAYFSDASNLEAFKQGRVQNKTDQKYCW